MGEETGNGHVCSRESAMRKSYLLVLVLVALASACESDEAKYRRLNQDLLIAQLELTLAERHYDDLSRFEKGLVNAPMPGPKTQAYYDTVETARTKVALLQRKMNSFMGGQ